MTEREKTQFDLDFKRDMQDPEFRAAYERARARIGAIDELVRKLDTERAAQKMTKADLAREMGMAPDAIRRLFSADQPNPTMKTIVAAADALGLRVTAVPVKRKRPSREPTRKKRERVAA